MSWRLSWYPLTSVRLIADSQTTRSLYTTWRTGYRRMLKRTSHYSKIIRNDASTSLEAKFAIYVGRKLAFDLRHHSLQDSWSQLPNLTQIFFIPCVYQNIKVFFLFHKSRCRAPKNELTSYNVAFQVKNNAYPFRITWSCFCFIKESV